MNRLVIWQWIAEGSLFSLIYLRTDILAQCDAMRYEINFNIFYLNYVLGEAWFFMIIIVQIIWANEMVQLPFGFSE